MSNQTPADQIWKKIKRINGNKTSSISTTLINPKNNSYCTTLESKAELLADTFAHNSSDENFTEKFRELKDIVIRKPFINPKPPWIPIHKKFDLSIYDNSNNKANTPEPIY
ncbi:Protein of unknown function [Cotesia congregata]|uniref:Uncharacterized protein n=1 Tax=Cotesia congregata TaxID=51543 RepID=A0A8J2HJ92_COTCN|nr:Protein of unknown function [Cotesia congregata]